MTASARCAWSCSLKWKSWRHYRTRIPQPFVDTDCVPLWRECLMTWQWAQVHSSPLKLKCNGYDDSLTAFFSLISSILSRTFYGVFGCNSHEHTHTRTHTHTHTHKHITGMTVSWKERFNNGPMWPFNRWVIHPKPSQQAKQTGTMTETDWDTQRYRLRYRLRSIDWDIDTEI